MEEKMSLVKILQESGLDKTKAAYILEKFQDYFKLADEWEKKAKGIVITSVTQTAEMKMAGVGRKFLKEKRGDVEKARKEMKEEYLRGGKAVDGIANVLKALIVPIEEYLESQEKYAENLAAAEAKRIMEERWVKEEADRIEMERKEEKENERIRAENERLRRENEERMKAENKRLRKEAEEREKKAASERNLAEKIAKEEKEKADARLAAVESKASAARREQEQERTLMSAAANELQRRLDALVECPKCGHKFTLGGK